MTVLCIKCDKNIDVLSAEINNSYKIGDSFIVCHECINAEIDEIDEWKRSEVARGEVW